MLAGLLAMGLTEASLPVFSHIMQKQLTLFGAESQLAWLFIGLIVLAVGIISGLYPSFYLSAGRPVSVLGAKGRPRRGGLGARRGLVVFQFGLAAFLASGLIVIQRQLNYVRASNLGFDQEQVVIIPNAWQLLNRDPNFIARDSIAELPGVLQVTSGSDLGALGDDGHYHRMRGAAGLVDIINMEIDHQFLDVFGIELVEGKTFSPTTTLRSFEDVKIILNETAVVQLGLEEPVVGQHAVFVKDNVDFEIPIIGVVRDFHANSLHREIKPIYFTWNNEALNYAVNSPI